MGKAKTESTEEAPVKKKRRARGEPAPKRETVAPEGSFSEVLFNAREAAGLSKVEMALKMKVKPPVVTKIESGRHHVSEKTVQKYAIVLGLQAKLTFVKQT